VRASDAARWALPLESWLYGALQAW